MSSEAITLQLPIPSPKLRSNGSFGKAFVYRDAFRKAKAEAVREAQRVLADLGIEPPGWKRARYCVTCFHLTAQRMDPGNLIACMKAYEDGIAEAGIIENDRELYPESPRFVRTDRMPRVEIVITPQ